MKIVILLIGLLALFATAGCQTNNGHQGGMGESPGYPYVFQPYNQDH